MTVANQTNRISAVGNAAIGQEVPFSFPYAATSDIKVYSRVTATGVETLLTETTNYTLTAASDTGGTLTTVTAVAATSEIHIIRDTPKTQALDLEAGGSFSAENIEDALDKNTKLILENKDSLDRALRAPATDAVALDLEIPNSVDRASKNLGFDAGGNVAVTDSSGTFATQTAVWDDVITKSPEADVRAYGAPVDGTTDASIEIQAAIDAMSTRSGTAGRKGIVTGAGRTYAINAILLKRGVILENIRLIPNTAAATMVKVSPGAEFRGIIDTTGLTFSGKAVSLDTDDWAVNYDNLPGTLTKIQADLFGTVAQGTALYLHENAANRYISFTEFRLNIDGFSVGIDAYAQHAVGFITGNTFYGVIRGGTTQIITRGAAVGGNLFYMNIQPVSGDTDRGFYIEEGGANSFNGFIWDSGDYATSAVEFGASAADRNRVKVGANLVEAKIVNLSAFGGNSVLSDWGSQYTFRNTLAATTKTALMALYEFAGGMWALDMGATTVLNSMYNHMDFRVGTAFKRTTPTYGANVAIDASLGNIFEIVVTDGNAFQIDNPTNVVTNVLASGHWATIRIKNTSGGAMGVITWDTLYKLAAWTSPANGFSRSITFKFDGANWVESSRTTVDVPN